MEYMCMEWGQEINGVHVYGMGAGTYLCSHSRLSAIWYCCRSCPVPSIMSSSFSLATSPCKEEVAKSWNREIESLTSSYKRLYAKQPWHWTIPFPHCTMHFMYSQWRCLMMRKSATCMMKFFEQEVFSCTYPRHSYHELDKKVLQPRHHIYKPLLTKDKLLTWLKLDVQELHKMTNLSPGGITDTTRARGGRRRC